MLPKQVFASYDRAQEINGKPYRYCPICGTPLTPATSTSARARCASCRWVHYENPSPGVVVLITEEDRVLLGKRGTASFAAHKWCLPGGFVEFEEDFLTAGIREVREETGLQVEVQSILSVVSNFLAAGLHTFVVVLHACIVDGDPVPGDDIVEVRWFPLKGPFPDMAFEADRHIIERFYSTALLGIPVDPRYARPSRTPPPAPPLEGEGGKKLS